MRQSAQVQITQKVRSCRCNEHGQTPRLKAKGCSLQELKSEVEGCCEELIDEVMKRLGTR